MNFPFQAAFLTHNLGLSSHFIVAGGLDKKSREKVRDVWTTLGMFDFVFWYSEIIFKYKKHSRLALKKVVYIIIFYWKITLVQKVYYDKIVLIKKYLMFLRQFPCPS